MILNKNRVTFQKPSPTSYSSSMIYPRNSTEHENVPTSTLNSLIFFASRFLFRTPYPEHGSARGNAECPGFRGDVESENHLILIYSRENLLHPLENFPPGTPALQKVGISGKAYAFIVVGWSFKRRWSIWRLSLTVSETDMRFNVCSRLTIRS